MHTTACTQPASRTARAMRRLVEIQEAAATLVIERGYDGFTMDELAERVGVSRRTLFNHVPDKASAVLGPFGENNPRPGALELVLEKQPHGRLVDDLVHAIDTVIASADDLDATSPGHRALVNRAIMSDAKVMQLVAHRFEVVAAMLRDAIAQREGWEPSDLRARVLATTMLSMLKLTLDDFAGGQDAPPIDFTTRFHEVLAAAVEVHEEH